MKTNRAKKIFAIIVIGIIATILMLLNKISLAVDGDTATAAAKEEIPVEEVAESVVTDRKSVV